MSLLLTGCGSGKAADLPDGTLLVASRRAAPLGLAGRTVDGGSADLATWRGQVVVLNVWGSWCHPCQQEAPDLAAISRDLAPQGVRFLGLDERDTPGAAVAFQQRYGVGYPSISDDDGGLVARIRQLPVAAVPTTLLLDRQGRPAARLLGRVHPSQLLPLVRALLAEPA